MIALQFKIGLDPIVELLLKWSVGVVGSTTGSKWWEHTRLTLTAAAITPRMKRAQRDCCYGTMTPISFPHHKKYCASPIRSLNWFLVTILCRLSTDFLSSPWAKLLFTVEIFLLESSNLLSRNRLNGFIFPTLEYYAFCRYTPSGLNSYFWLHFF